MRRDGGWLRAQPEPDRLVGPIGVGHWPGTHGRSVRIEALDRAIDAEPEPAAVGQRELVSPVSSPASVVADPATGGGSVHVLSHRSHCRPAVAELPPNCRAAVGGGPCFYRARECRGVRPDRKAEHSMTSIRLLQLGKLAAVGGLVSAGSGRPADRRRNSRHCSRRCSRQARRRRYGPQEGIRSVARFGPARRARRNWRLCHLPSALGSIPSNEMDR